MSVAIKLFYQKGYYATSLSDIAAMTGLKKASLYYHFPKKEDLLKQILITTLDDLLHELDKALNADACIHVQLERAIACHINFHIKRQKEVLIADSELRGLSPQNLKLILQKRKAYEARFQELISKGIQTRAFTETNVKVASYAILTLCTSVAIWYRPTGPLAPEEIVDVYQKLILDGLKCSNRDAVDLKALGSI